MVWNEAKCCGPFIARFQFQISDTGYNYVRTYAGGKMGGDGFAFVLQNDASNCIGSASEGGPGAIVDGDLGYTGLTSCLAVEFDMYYNPEYGDPDGNHISVHSNGTLADSASHHCCDLATVSPTIWMKDGKVHTVWIDYNVVPSTFRVFMDDSLNALLSTGMNLTNINGVNILDANGDVWVGFTASSLFAYENHDILSWSLDYITVNASNDTTCANTPFQLSPTVEGIYPPFTYQWSPATGLNSTTVAKPIAMISQATTYRLVVTDANGNTATANTTLTVLPKPAVTISAGITLCQGATGTIEAL